MQALVSRLEEKGKGVSLKISQDKTVVMRRARIGMEDIVWREQTFKEDILVRYLGTIRKDGSLKNEFTERLRKANKAGMGMFSKVWKCHRLATHAKLYVYKSLVRSVLVNGRELWYDIKTISRQF